MKTSSLYECFENHLQEVGLESESNELFIARVLESYITQLLEAGFNLGPYAEEVYEDLQEEVLEMLQKKIYGYTSVGEFRKAAGEAE